MVANFVLVQVPIMSLVDRRSEGLFRYRCGELDSHDCFAAIAKFVFAWITAFVQTCIDFGRVFGRMAERSSSSP